MMKQRRLGYQHARHEGALHTARFLKLVGSEETKRDERSLNIPQR